MIVTTVFEVIDYDLCDQNRSSHEDDDRSD
jgi:hypothetical protein